MSVTPARRKPILLDRVHARVIFSPAIFFVDSRFAIELPSEKSTILPEMRKTRLASARNWDFLISLFFFDVRVLYELACRNSKGTPAALLFVHARFLDKGDTFKFP